MFCILAVLAVLVVVAFKGGQFVFSVWYRHSVLTSAYGLEGEDYKTAFNFTRHPELLNEINSSTNYRQMIFDATPPDEDLKHREAWAKFCDDGS